MSLYLTERIAQKQLRTTAAVNETVTRAALLQAPYACDPIVSKAVDAPNRKNLAKREAERDDAWYLIKPLTT